MWPCHSRITKSQPFLSLGICLLSSAVTQQVYSSYQYNFKSNQKETKREYENKKPGISNITTIINIFSTRPHQSESNSQQHSSSWWRSATLSLWSATLNFINFSRMLMFVWFQPAFQIHMQSSLPFPVDDGVLFSHFGAWFWFKIFYFCSFHRNKSQSASQSSSHPASRISLG